MKQKRNMDLKVREDIIKAVLIADQEWLLPYRMYLIQEILKGVDTFYADSKGDKLFTSASPSLYSTSYSGSEIITRNKIHSNHWEIFKVSHGKREKIATAFMGKNCQLILNALTRFEKGFKND